MPRRGADSPFFDAFRAAVGGAPAGLLRPGPPADPQALRAAEARLGAALPDSYAAFLRSFDGAALFEESIRLCGVGPQAPCDLVAANLEDRPSLARPGELLFGETSAGDRFLLAADGGVHRLRGDAEERWRAGSSFPRWLEATVARELMLYDDEGEFLLEAFEEDGEELRPTFALRQAERALRKDPGSAEAHHDLGVALRRIGKLPRALDAFAAAARLDPENPWPGFDEGRTALALGEPARAAEAFRRAAALVPPAEGARFLAWAARAHREAGDEARATAARQDAERIAPGLRAALARAVEAAAAEGDVAAREEAEALVAALEPPKRRLPLAPG